MADQIEINCTKCSIGLLDHSLVWSTHYGGEQNMLHVWTCNTCRPKKQFSCKATSIAGELKFLRETVKHQQEIIKAHYETKARLIEWIGINRYNPTMPRIDCYKHDCEYNASPLCLAVEFIEINESWVMEDADQDARCDTFKKRKV